VTWLRQLRIVRLLRAAMTILAALCRYTWLRIRARIPGIRPTQASWDKAHRKTGRAIHHIATRYRGAFVKLGQILGARADVMPPPLIEPLRGLHDRVPPRPLAKLRDHLARELGRPIEDVFESIDETPLAAASLAQVHRARLRSGEDVVVKIQYPEARRLFPVDLGSMRRSVRVARWLARVDLRPLADELRDQVCLELEFLREAAATKRVREAFAGDPMVVVPRVIEAHEKVLILEFVAGTALTRLDALREAGVDLREVARSVARLYAVMIFEHGFFHGDPHPGNLLVDPDGKRIALLDFGLAKELPPGFADGVAGMLRCGLTNDLDGAVAAARSIGFDIRGEPAALRDLLLLLTGDRSGGKNPLEALRAASMKGVPPDFAIVARAFVLLSGLSHSLVPNERVIVGAVMQQLVARSANLRA
jgi:ubiquinone biosynthesis protein